MVISLSFRESNAIFTDLFFFTVITAGLMKQFSSMLFAFLICPCFMSLFTFFRPIVVDGSVLAFPFVVSAWHDLSTVFSLRFRLRCGFR